MSTLIEFIDWLMTLVEYWRFWAWFVPGVVLAIVVYHMSHDIWLSRVAAACVLGYCTVRGIRAESESGDRSDGDR